MAETKVFESAEYTVWEEQRSGVRTVRIEPKAGSSVANRETILGRAEQALQANATYLAVASPTAAQNTAQVQRLTKQSNALIRLLVGRFDSTDGTA